MNNNICEKKQRKETMKESNTKNNVNTHAYMQAVSNMIFTHIYTEEGIMFWGERNISAMMKEPRQLEKEAMPVKTVVIPLKLDELTDSERR